jgi:hypothetical protein
MRLPLDRRRMRERNALDEAQAWARARRLSPAERLRSELDLCDLVGRLGGSIFSGAVARLDLEEKARLWAAPLRILAEKARER